MRARIAPAEAELSGAPQDRPGADRSSSSQDHPKDRRSSSSAARANDFSDASAASPAPSPSPLEAAAAERLTWLCTFRDAELEHIFEVDMRLEHARAYAFTSCFVLIVYPITLLSELSLPHSGPTSINNLVSTFAYVYAFPVFLLSVAVWRSPSFRARVSFAVLDSAFISWLVIAAVNMIVFTPERSALVEARLRGTVTDELELAAASTSGWVTLVRVCVVFMGAGLFTRMQLLPFAIACVLTVVATVIGETAVSLSDVRPLLEEMGVASFLLLAVVKATLHRIVTERKQWSYQREVLLGARTWEEMKRVELEARTERSRLSAAKDARSKLIRVVMHDLRSPLLAVRNMVDVLGQTEAHMTLESQPVLRALSAIATCTTLMEGIVSDMLDFERIDSGRLELVQAPFSLGRMLEDAEVAFAALAESKGLRLVCEPLPTNLMFARYQGDCRRLLQCLSNGISNAIKFTDSGGEITLSVHEGAPLPHTLDKATAVGTPPAEAAIPSLVIRVQDTGVGLSSEELEVLRSGEAFAQVGRGQLQGNGGTGLGLNIVRHILRLHGQSELRLDSEGSGRGTSFEMVLYLRRVEDAPPEARRVRKPSRFSATFISAEFGGARHLPAPKAQSTRVSAIASSGRPSNSTIEDVPEVPTDVDADADVAPPAAQPGEPPPVACMHVEDDAMLQLTLGFRLFADPTLTTVVVASDGHEALEAVEQRAAAGLPPFELVLMDNQMPHMGGTETTAELRARGFTGMIIGMTGDPSGSPDRINFEKAGLSTCVDKTPQGLEVVEDAIRGLRRASEAKAAAA